MGSYLVIEDDCGGDGGGGEGGLFESSITRLSTFFFNTALAR
jgi:hypothetical protein